MNTANLELEGLYLAIAAINNRLVEKGLLTHADLQQAMNAATEAAQACGGDRHLSAANCLAIQFPARFLSLASERSASGEAIDFHAIAEAVGRRNHDGETRPDAAGTTAMPAAGPHAQPELTDGDKTPGAGVLPSATGGDVDPGAG